MEKSGISVKTVVFIATAVACVSALATLCVVYFDNIFTAVHSATDWAHSMKKKVGSITFHF